MQTIKPLLHSWRLVLIELCLLLLLPFCPPSSPLLCDIAVTLLSLYPSSTSPTRWQSPANTFDFQLRKTSLPPHDNLERTGHEETQDGEEYGYPWNTEHRKPHTPPHLLFSTSPTAPPHHSPPHIFRAGGEAHAVHRHVAGHAA